MLEAYGRKRQHRTCVVGEAGWLAGCGLPNLPCRISVASLTLRTRSSVPCSALCARFWAPFLEGQEAQKKVGRFSPRSTAGCLHELHLKPLNTDVLSTERGDPEFLPAGCGSDRCPMPNRSAAASSSSAESADSTSSAESVVFSSRDWLTMGLR